MTEPRVEYKGRTYLLAWSGMTRFGHRTKLKFLSGDKTFWVSTEEVSDMPVENPETDPYADLMRLVKSMPTGGEDE